MTPNRGKDLGSGTAPRLKSRSARKKREVGADFASAARAVFEHMRTAMMGLAKSSPGSIRRAVDLQKSLGIGPTLAWRVFKIAGATDVFEIVNYIPGLGEIDTLAEMARQRGVPLRVIDDVRAALQGYTDLLHEHAGNLATLRTMLDSLQPNKTAMIDEKCRRIAFEQNSIIWGTRSDVLLGCFILHPGMKPGTIRTAMIMGNVGFHEIRLERQEFDAATKTMSGETYCAAEKNIAAIDEEVLQEFCSRELDVRVREDGEFGERTTRVKPPGIGRRAAVDYFQLSTSEESEHSEDGNGLYMEIRRPAAMAHLDVLLPFSPTSRVSRACVFGRQGNINKVFNRRPADIMPLDISAVDMGAVVDIPPVPDIPRYGEMVQKVLKHKGWYGSKFNLYRCRLPYPVFSTLVSLDTRLASG